MYFPKHEIEKIKMILQKYTPFGKKQAKGMYFPKHEINKTKMIPHNNKHRTEDVLNNKHKSIDRN